MNYSSVLILASAFTAFASPGAAQEAQTFALTDTRVPSTPKAASTPRSTSFGFELPEDLPAHVLPPVDIAALMQEDALGGLESSTKTVRYGLGRDVQFRMDDGVWHELGEGRWLWTADIVSTGAAGLRVGIFDMNLPEGAEVTVHAPRDPGHIAGPYRSRGPFDDGHVWTPTRGGERVRLEYFVEGIEAGVMPGRPPFSIARLQHVYRDPTKSGASEEGAGACHNDVSCYPGMAYERDASAGIGFVSGPNSIWCTGQLLNTLAGDLTPYFLTANHCLSTNGEAQNAELFWDYESETCAGAVPSLASVPKSEVCTLLETSATSDYTLLMIEGALPAGRSWVGWTSVAPANGTAGFSVHHPSGTFKRISFGNYSTSASCAPAEHFRVNWTDGVTEGGSSGCGFYRTDTHQLVGQLHCGPSSCGGATFDGYGRFADTYPHIDELLEGGSDDYREPNDACGGNPDVVTGLYNNLVVKSGDEDWYEISVPAGAQLTVRLYFTHAFGDIDARLKVNCADAGYAVSASSNDDNEILTWVNTTGAANTVAWRVYLDSDVRNTYSMLVSFLSTNDACATAIELEDSESVIGTTVNSTNSIQGTCGGNFDSPDVWYRYSSPRNGIVRVSTAGSQLDTVISVYDECGGSLVTCNNDASAGDPVGNGTTSSYVSFPASVGHDFYVRVAGNGGAVGTFVIEAIADTGAPFCLGDGVSSANCPCGNASSSAELAGCRNSSGNAGRLSATGIADVSNDSVTLVGTGMMPLSTCLYFQGSAQHALGNGAAFGDGLRCAGGTVVRLAARTNDWSGTSQCSQSGGDSISELGLLPAGGGTRFYQVWYRNVASFCTASPFNLTNGYEIYWRP